MNKLAILICCALAGAAAPTSQALAIPAKSEQASTMSSAINKAGRQRMLSQRMTKLYCMVGQGILPEKAKQQLQQSIELFDMQLVELKKTAPNQDVKNAVAKMETAWLPYREIVSRAPTKDGGKNLVTLNEELLQASHKTTLLLQDIAGTPTGRLVNISGRQRMLSQRMAKFYMEKRRGFNNSEINDGLEQSRNEFKGALQELMTAPQNTPAIRKELELARTQWIFFENALTQQGDQDPVLATNVATASERILEVMDRVTGMYENL